MKFISELNLLSEAAENVSLAVAPKATNIAALDGILLECKENKLKLTGYDLDIAIIRTIDVDCKEEGSAIINSNMFCEMLRKMEGPQIEISCNEKNMFNIKDEVTDYNVMGIDKSEYPALPNKEDDYNFEIKGQVLKNMVSKTHFAAANDAAQTPVLCGCMFNIENNKLSVIAVDGYRVAIANNQIEAKGDQKFIVPSKTLKEVCKLIGEKNKPIKINVGKRHAYFEVFKYTVITRLLEGDFIDYNSAIPKESKTVIELKSNTLLKTVERISVVVTQKVSVIMHVNKEDSIEIESESSLGNSKERVSAKIDGEKLSTIAFNNKYMIDALRYAGGDVKIILNSPITPIKIIPKEGDDFLYLVLPVRLKSQL